MIAQSPSAACFEIVSSVVRFSEFQLGWGLRVRVRVGDWVKLLLAQFVSYSKREN